MTPTNPAPPADKKFWRQPDWLAAILLTAIIAGFHFYFLLHAGGFWRDEVNLINLAHSPSLAAMKQDSFPVLMPLLVRGWAAVSAGVSRLDTSEGGLGGCPFAPGASGNIATEDLVYLLRDSGIDVDIDLAAAIEAARVARAVVGHDLPSALLRAGDRMRG